jgi:CRP/FNR family transcriptional regulator
MSSPNSGSLPAPTEFAPGAVIFRQDEAATRLYVINSGHVRLTRRVFREEVLIETIGKGNVIGDIAVADGALYPVTATAVDEVRAVVVAQEQIEEQLMQNPRVLARMIQKLSIRLANLHFRFAALSLESTEARVLLQLRYELARQAIAPGGWCSLPFDLADVLALEPGVVNTHLRAIGDAGLIEVDGGGRFRVVDAAAYDRRLAYLELSSRFDR